MTRAMGVAAVPDAPPPMSAWKRLRVWLNMLFVDHSIFRFFFNTRYPVAPGVYRSSHPMPYQLRQAKKAGVRSVLSLRGTETHIGSNILEWETCHELGLVLANFPIASRDAPWKDQLQTIDRLLRDMPKPMLIHCKSGADRAGLVSTLYHLLREKQPLEQARRELSFWRFGHVKQAKTGILDHFFDCYQQHHQAHGTGFMDWVEHHYDRDAVVASFHSNWWANKLVDWVLRRE